MRQRNSPVTRPVILVDKFHAIAFPNEDAFRVPMSVHPRMAAIFHRIYDAPPGNCHDCSLMPFAVRETQRYR